MLSMFFQILICMYLEPFSGDSFPNNVKRSNKEADNITYINNLWGMEGRKGRLQGGQIAITAIEKAQTLIVGGLH